MNKVDDLDFVSPKPINESITLNEQFANVWIIFFWDDPSALSELLERTRRVAGFPYEGSGVPW